MLASQLTLTPALSHPHPCGQLPPRNSIIGEKIDAEASRGGMRSFSESERRWCEGESEAGRRTEDGKAGNRRTWRVVRVKEEEEEEGGKRDEKWQKVLPNVVFGKQGKYFVSGSECHAAGELSRGTTCLIYNCTEMCGSKGHPVNPSKGKDASQDKHDTYS